MKQFEIMKLNGKKSSLKMIKILVVAIVSLTLSSYTGVIKSGGGNPWLFYSSITAWREATESETYYIFYKEGNGERKYVIFLVRDLDECPFCSYEEIVYNGYFQDSNCNDFRKNYQYKTVFPDGMTYYFNCSLPYREKSKYPYVYYANVTAWYEATESETYYIFYKEGNGQRKYMVFPYRNIEECPQCGFEEIGVNRYYRDPNCNDYRKNYQYKFASPGGMSYYFNCSLP